MKFALIGNNSVEAEPKQQGICPYCSQPVLAKCGSKKMWHWAHRNISSCDSWWETETHWHREWKGNFPNEWQEKILFDGLTNEKHIADVRTTSELIIEFQHSHINPIERRERELFYKNMIWIVDGTRLKKDFPRFIKAKNDWIPLEKSPIFGIEFADECFPKNWLDSAVPVIFDFNGTATIENEINDTKLLYCIFPIKLGRLTIFAEISRKALIKSIINDEWQKRYGFFIEYLNEQNRLRTEKEKMDLIKRQSQAMFEFNQKLLGGFYTSRRRRF